METLTYPNFRQSIWLAVLFILWIIVAYIILRIAGVSFYLKGTLTYVTMAIALGIAFWRKYMDRSILRYNQLDTNILLLAIGGTLCMPWVHALISSILPTPEFITQIYAELETVAFARNGRGGYFLIINILFFPFIMEVLFRGVILRGLQTEYTAWKSILIAATIYAAVWGCLTLFPIQGLLYGIWFGWLYVYSRSLWTSLLSFIFSQIVSVTYVLSTQWFTIPEQVNSAMNGKLWIVNLIATLLFGVLTYCLYQTFKRNGK